MGPYNHVNQSANLIIEPSYVEKDWMIHWLQLVQLFWGRDLEEQSEQYRITLYSVSLDPP